MSKNYKYNTAFDSNYWMESNGFYVGINTPESLPEKDFAQSLPDYYKLKGMLVDEYPAAPKNWMPSEGKLASYFVGVQENRGMWLDFNKNSKRKHHVAIVVSVQGVNPITGLPVSDPQLEQYVETCPKCKIKFKANRHCEGCGYQWPKQNYICTTGTPNGNLWLDGFKSADGIVRQYILTQEKIRGVAENITGGKQVYAIGISFFLSKQEKPINQQVIITRGHNYSWSFDNSATPYGAFLPKNVCKTYTEIATPSTLTAPYERDVYSTAHVIKRKGAVPVSFTEGVSCQNNYSDNINDTLSFANENTVNIEKNLEVGAGAKINQTIHDDPEDLSFWRDEVESIICINYCIESDANKILSQGRTPLSKKEEGFLQGIPVGN